MAFRFNPDQGGSAELPSKMPSSSSVEVQKCPCDPSHEVMSFKMDTHVNRCRLQFRRSGNEVTYLSCQYNYNHQIPMMEVMYHESRCKDGEYVPTYLLNAVLEASPLGKKFDKLEPTKAELHRMYEGLYINKFVGAASFAKPIPFSEIPSGGYIDPIVDKALNKTVPKGNIEPRPSTSGKTKFFKNKMGEDEEESKEDWDNENHRPTWNYMENFFNLKKPLLKYPPMLKTKQQRRKYVEWNREWIESIEADEPMQVPDVSDDEERLEMPLRMPKEFTVSAEEIAHEALHPVGTKEFAIDETEGAVGGASVHDAAFHSRHYHQTKGPTQKKWRK